MAINIKYPLEDDAINGNLFALNNRTKAAILSNILLYLYTKKGERFYNPNSGTSLLQFFFEPNDVRTEEDIKDFLKRDLESAFRNLRVLNIIISEESNENENLKVLTLELSYNSGSFAFTELVQIEFAV